MERVIKFRALKDDMSNCNYVYGCLVYAHGGVPRISTDGLTFHTCLKETVGQFTGLHDKHGKEAYDGNLYKETLLTGEQRYYKIFSVKGGFAINQFQDDFYKPIDEIFFWQALSDVQTIGWFESSLEEIGSIHTNQELINQK